MSQSGPEIGLRGSQGKTLTPQLYGYSQRARVPKLFAEFYLAASNPRQTLTWIECTRHYALRTCKASNSIKRNSEYTAGKSATTDSCSADRNLVLPEFKNMRKIWKLHTLMLIKWGVGTPSVWIIIFKSLGKESCNSCWDLSYERPEKKKNPQFRLQVQLNLVWQRTYPYNSPQRSLKKYCTRNQSGRETTR